MGHRREWQTLLGLVLCGGALAWWRWTKRRTPDRGALPHRGAGRLSAGEQSFFPECHRRRALALRPARVCLPRRRPHPARPDARLAARNAGAVSSCGAWGIWLGVRTWQRQPDWQDQRTFLTRTIAAGGDTVRMRVNLGQLESARGDDRLALEQFREALQREPAQPFAQLGAAAVLIRLGNYDAAEPLLALAEKTRASSELNARTCAPRSTRLKTGADTSASAARGSGGSAAFLARVAALFRGARTHWATRAAIRELRAFLEREPSALNPGRCSATCWRRSTTPRTLSPRLRKPHAWTCTIRSPATALAILRAHAAVNESCRETRLRYRTRDGERFPTIPSPCLQPLPFSRQTAERPDHRRPRLDGESRLERADLRSCRRDRAARHFSARCTARFGKKSRACGRCCTWSSATRSTWCRISSAKATSRDRDPARTGARPEPAHAARRRARSNTASRREITRA